MGLAETCFSSIIYFFTEDPKSPQKVISCKLSLISEPFNMINTRKMRYTPDAMAAFEASSLYSDTHACTLCDVEDATYKSDVDAFSNRIWNHMQHRLQTPLELKGSARNIGEYPFTSELAPWVKNTMANFQPDGQVLDLVKYFSAELHVALDAERRSSSGLHDLNVIELTYQ